jgi:hypothetical protein
LTGATLCTMTSIEKCIYHWGGISGATCGYVLGAY